MTKETPLDIQIEVLLEAIEENIHGRGYRPYTELEFMRIMLQAELARQKTNQP